MQAITAEQRKEINYLLNRLYQPVENELLISRVDNIIHLFSTSFAEEFRDNMIICLKKYSIYTIDGIISKIINAGTKHRPSIPELEQMAKAFIEEKRSYIYENVKREFLESLNPEITQKLTSGQIGLLAICNEGYFDSDLFKCSRKEFQQNYAIIRREIKETDKKMIEDHGVNIAGYIA